MKSSWATPMAIAAACLLATACSKPADKAAADATATTTDAAATAAAGPTDPGGAVSPPAANGAVNTDANTTETATSAASSSFTEGQAKGHIEHAGYTDVTGLTKTADGLWTGMAKKDGKSVSVSVDFKGAVTAK